MTGPPPPRAGGLSLYADLLDPPADSSASISRAPVVSQHALEAVKEQEVSKKLADPALRFQPLQSIRRPQQKTQKPKAGFPKVIPTASNASPSGASAAASLTAPAKSTLADWAATEDDEWMYTAGEKRARGGRKKKKRNKDNTPVETNWDELYDPSRPTNVDEYLRSDERIREVRDWKSLLYRHKRLTKRQSSWDSDEDEDRPPAAAANQFAPPGSYSFAPPPSSPPRASVSDDKIGNDAYARRIALSQGFAPPPPPQTSPSPLRPPPPPLAPELETTLAPPPPPFEPETATISRAPVRYIALEPPAKSPSPPVDPDAMDEDVPASDEPEQRSNRPGQKGFAARLMSKYGWSKGQGLGADATGMVAPLRVQVEKRKKKPDSEGGGWAVPGGRGKIIAPKGSAAAAAAQSSSTVSDSKFGPTSNVIVLRHMLDGLEDLRHEMEEGLGQEIGEECGDKYGRVERLYIDVEGRTVYIKFVDGVSALRAVNSLDGRVFAGHAIKPRFYNVDMFEKGVYE